jgi:hypothetical protein
MALQDICLGRGVCVIDPTGDLVNRLVHWIPKERVKDTIFFDTDSPVPIDFFSYRNAAERQVLSDQLLDLFQLDDAPVSKPRLERIIGTLFDANERGGDCTFLDIERFIESKKRRAEILDVAPHRKYQWPDEKFKRITDYNSITERISKFSESPTLKIMFDAKKPKPTDSWKMLNIWDVMQEKKVLLVNLKDTPTDLFIGSLICAKIQQATFGRRYILESQRTPYYLYIDECGDIMGYAAPEFKKILLRARKYKLCLTLANQIPEDLPKEIKQKIGTIGTLVLFNLDAEDARIFEARIRPFEIEELLLLPKFKALCRIDGVVQKVTTPTFLGPSPASYAKSIKKRTYDHYACNSGSVGEDESDGHHNTSAEKPEYQPAGAPRDIPSHENKV